MPALGEKTISLVQAARLLYRTKAPSGEQIDRVLELMRSGELSAHDGGKNPQRWTTTNVAIADYLATKRVRRNRDGKPVAAEDAVPVSRGQLAAKAKNEMNLVYHGIWRDYFLALMWRRRIAHRGVAFRRAVVAGQVVMLLALAGIFLSAIFAIRGRIIAPAEHQAVARWIEANTDDFAIQKWHPTQATADGQVLNLTVEYRYRKDSPRWIHTKRTFAVTDGTTRELVEGE